MKFPVVCSHKNYDNLYKKLCDSLFFIVNNPLLFVTDKYHEDLIKITKKFYVFLLCRLISEIPVTNKLKNILCS